MVVEQHIIPALGAHRLDRLSERHVQAWLDADEGAPRSVDHHRVLSRLRPDGWAIIVGTLWTDGDIVDNAEQSGAYVVVKMRALSAGATVEADVEIPDGVKWRPSLSWREVES